MEPREYNTMFEFETSYWWYRGLHLILIDTLKALELQEGARVLDAGCGTGQNLFNVCHIITAQAYGFDVSPEAASFWARRGLSKVCQASINDIPFPADTFDAVMSVDVFECDSVAEDRAIVELLRILRPSGYLILVVPAYDWLLSEEHHKAVQASRRYSRTRVESLLRKENVNLIRITHLFASLLPVVAAYRIALPYLRSESDVVPRSELRPLHPFINTMLFKLVNLERRILKRRNFPFGSSILAIARKVV